MAAVGMQGPSSVAN